MKTGGKKTRHLTEVKLIRGTTSLKSRTRVVEVAESHTLTEYLSKRGLEPGVKLDTSKEFSAESILSVEAGRKYQLGPILAKGGMGTVYEARDLNCRRRVALKVLPKDQQHQVEDLLRFIEEAQISSQLEHPNIVPIHELGIDAEGNVFYTMKYVKGVTLTEILDGIRRGKQDIIDQHPLERLLTIFQKACDATAYAHSKGVVHRDLKPDNIMVGDYGEVLVMDWGLAKVVRNPAVSTSPAVPVADRVQVDEEAERLEAAAEEKPGQTEDELIDSVRTDKIGSGLRTMSGRIMGTPGFMAPEQARATGTEVDSRSDIYSLGAILYSILTLRPSVRGKDIKDTLRKIIHGEIVAPVEYNRPEMRKADARGRPVVLPHCPNGLVPLVLSEIVMKAMAIEPADRYATVKDLQNEVELYQRGQIWNLVVDEDFMGENWRDRWEVVGGQVESKAGELRLHGGEPQLLLLKRDVPGDVRIEFDCRQEGLYLNTVGCFCSSVRSANRKEIPSSGYELKYGAYENTMNVLMRSDKKVWSQRAAPLTRGEEYHVRAERVGSRLRMLVNDAEVFRFVDPDPLSGADRTAVGILGWMADTVFTQIRIYSLGTPLQGDVLDTAERHLLKGHYNTAGDLFREVIESAPDPQRLERARRGIGVAEARHAMMLSMPQWKERLERAWPGKGVQLRMDNDGLAVEISNAGIDNLEPLRGLPLTSLYCLGNRIASLEPLRGMPLITLNCGGNPIESLEPLRGMPLVTLFCEHCRIASLEPLRGAPLTMLNCGGNGRITSLEPLRGMSLNWLCCWGCQVGTLEPLRGLALTTLYCDHTNIDSLEPLRDMPLSILHFSGNRVASLEPLAGMPLTTLHCGHNLISSLEPLKDMPLFMFSCHYNRVKSLAPLKGIPLAALMCGENEITGVESFIKNPPEVFLFNSESISIQELEWIHKTWSRDFRLSAHAQHVEVILALRRGEVAALKGLATEFRGHRYLFIPKYASWEDAKAEAERIGAHLATITSKEENDFIASMFPGGSWFWIGLKTTERGQEWVTGEPFGFGVFVDAVRERLPGPKVFFNGMWSYDVDPQAHNCFIVEWDG